MALGDYLKTERLLKLPWYQKALIVGMGALIIVIIYFTTLDRKYKNEITRLRDEIAKLEKQITDLKTVERDLKKFERQNELLKRDLEKAMTKLPSKAQIDALLKEIASQARTYSVDIVAFEKKQERNEPLYVEVPVDIKMKGGFFQSMIFLNKLAQMPRIVNVDGLAIKTDKIGNLELSFTLNAYRFREPSETAPEPKKGASKSGLVPIKKGE